MKKLAAVTSVNYCVDLTLKQFLALDARDQREQDAGNHCDLDSILSGTTHAQAIEFNGHFGAAVFFSLDADSLDDAEVIAKMIKMYANRKSLTDIFEASKGSSYSHRGNTKFISAFESAVGRYKESTGAVVELRA